MQPFADAKAAKSSDSARNSNQYIWTEYRLLHSILYRSNRQFSSRAFEQLSSPRFGNTGNAGNADSASNVVVRGSRNPLSSPPAVDSGKDH